ncbi:hypothetical protein B1M_10376, partial [Burkholderia sp. TJI49]
AFQQPARDPVIARLLRQEQETTFRLVSILPMHELQ